ncbi:MAG: hypothetical protein JSS75_05025 [Bacteroidetes bacterium]|nr:hypothetical protein [Bacteroidota bacterium]
MTGVWVFGPDDIYLVGNNLYRFDGSSFHQIHTRDSTHHVTMDGAMNGYSIFAFDTNHYWLIHYGGDAVHSLTNGVFEDFRPGQTNACWGQSSHDLFVVGNAGQIHHYDGTTFTDMASPTTKDLRSVWGTSHNDVWACGANVSTGQTTLLHYDGTIWTEDPLANTESAKRSGMFVVWAGDSLGHHLAVTAGSNVYHRTDGGAWRNDTTLVPNSLGQGTFVGLYLLSANSSTDIMAAGSWGWVGHWNGKTWQRYDALYDYSNVNYIGKALSLKGNTACVVGTKNGQSWVAIGRRAK